MASWPRPLPLLLCAGARLAAGDTVSMVQNASVPQLELASRAAMSPLALDVATCEADALIVHVQGSEAGTSFTLRVQSGYVVMEWLTGEGATARELPNYNAYVGDCEWHSIALDWGGSTISLSVDGGAATAPSGGPVGSAFLAPDLGVTVLVGTPRRFNTSLGSFETVLQAQPYEGCMRNLVLAGTPVSFLPGAVAQNIGAGCPASIFTARLPTIDESRAMTFGTNPNVTRPFAQYYRSDLGLPYTSTADRIEFNVRTRESSGVIFYVGSTSSTSGEQYLLVRLLEGAPYLSFRLDGQTRGNMVASFAVNDGEWHSVTVSRVNLAFNMTLNERTRGPTSRVSLEAPGATSILSIPGELYVGGVPASYSVPQALRGVTSTSLVGCLHNATFNWRALNFDTMRPFSSGVARGCSGRPGQCAPNPCASFELCVDDFNQPSCVCPAGFTGPSCATNIDECASHDCANGATCVDGINSYTCRCTPAWLGPRCTIPNPCASNPCGSGGTCSTPPTGGTYTCACNAGRYGANCDQVCDQGNCVGQVTCDQATGRALRCSACTSGYFGAGLPLSQAGDPPDELPDNDGSGGGEGPVDASNDCEQQCASQVCAAVTQCAKVSGATQLCTGCLGSTRYGPACATGCSQGNCVGTVRCDQSGGARQCDACADTWRGANCSEPCQPGPGCALTAAFTHTCSQATGAMLSCSGCNAGYYGAACESQCAQSNCVGNVTCDKATGGQRVCPSCQPGYFGASCNMTCARGNCASVVTCDQQAGDQRTCAQCDAGWEGPSCDTDIDECDPDPCSGHGECADGLASFNCTCNPGWVGADCSIRFEREVTFSLANDSYFSISPSQLTIAGVSTTWSELSFQFTTPPSVSSGVLVYATGFGSSDFSVELVQGSLLVGLTLPGGQSLRFTQAGPFNDGRWHLVNVSLAAGVISVDRQFTLPMSASAPASFSVDGELAVGGPPLWDAALLRRLVSGEYYGGCVRDVTANGDEILNIVLASRSAGIQYGCAGAQAVCSTVDCGHGTCVDGWVSHECECDFGWEGPACDRAIAQYTFPGPSLVRATARSSGGAFVQNGLDFRSPSSIQVAFRTRVANNTLVLAHSQSSGHTFGVLLAASGRIVVSGAGDGADAFQVATPGSLNDGQWHRVEVRVGFAPSTVALLVDGAEAASAAVPWITNLTVWDAVVSVGADPADPATGFFSGCLWGLRVNSLDIPMSAANSTAAVTVTASQTPVEVGCRSRDVCAPAFNACPANTSTCVDLWNLANCTCNAGYGPPGVCNVDFDDCAADPSACNAGRCVDNVGFFTCDCNGTGFDGDRCQNNIDECASSPCVNGGECRDRVLGFECDCPPQFNGTLCENEVDECDASPCDADEFCTHVPSAGQCSDVNCTHVGYACTQYRRCVAGQTYATSNGTATTDRQCANATACDPQTEYASVVATEFVNRNCTEIRPPCGNGTYQSAAPTSTSDRVCSACGGCRFGQYAVSLCNSTHDIGCAPCDQCLNGGECFANTVGVGFQCRCRTAQFSGTFCEVVDPCFGNPCGAHGTCAPSGLAPPSQMFACTCTTPGYGGPLCQPLTTTSTTTTTAPGGPRGPSLGSSSSSDGDGITDTFWLWVIVAGGAVLLLLIVVVVVRSSTSNNTYKVDSDFKRGPIDAEEAGGYAYGGKRAAATFSNPVFTPQAAPFYAPGDKGGAGGSMSVVPSSASAGGYATHGTAPANDNDDDSSPLPARPEPDRVPPQAPAGPGASSV